MQEERCVAIEHRFTRPGLSGYSYCGFLDGRNAIRVRTNPRSKLIVFLPRLQRERKTLVLANTKIKNFSPRTSVSVTKIEDCIQTCGEDLFCRAFVMCNRSGKNSWCGSTKGNCYLYSENGIDNVVPDDNSQVHFVWKNFTQTLD